MAELSQEYVIGIDELSQLGSEIGTILNPKTNGEATAKTIEALAMALRLSYKKEGRDVSKAELYSRISETAYQMVNGSIRVKLNVPSAEFVKFVQEQKKHEESK